MANGTTVIYIGAGGYLHGVPARDMTSDEWAALPEDVRKVALDLDLYQLPKQDEPKPAPSRLPAPPKDNKESEGV